RQNSWIHVRGTIVVDHVAMSLAFFEKAPLSIRLTSGVKKYMFRKQFCGIRANFFTNPMKLSSSRSIGVSWTASDFAVQHPPLLCRKRFCCVASAFPRQHLTLLSSIVYANFEATTTYTLCTTTYRLWWPTFSHTSEFVSY